MSEKRGLKYAEIRYKTQTSQSHDDEDNDRKEGDELLLTQTEAVPNEHETYEQSLSSSGEDCCDEDCAEELKACKALLSRNQNLNEKEETKKQPAEGTQIPYDEAFSYRVQGLDDDDSCEAVADEQESIADSQELNEGDLEIRSYINKGPSQAIMRDKQNSRWDFFPMDEKEDSQTNINKILTHRVPNYMSQRQFRAYSGQNQVEFGMSEERRNEWRDQSSHDFTDRYNMRATSPSLASPRDPRSFRYRMRQTLMHHHHVSKSTSQIMPWHNMKQPKACCLLRRNVGSKPFFVKQNSKGSLERQDHDRRNFFEKKSRERIEMSRKSLHRERQQRDLSGIITKRLSNYSLEKSSQTLSRGEHPLNLKNSANKVMTPNQWQATDTKKRVSSNFVKQSYRDDKDRALFRQPHPMNTKNSHNYTPIFNQRCSPQNRLPQHGFPHCVPYSGSLHKDSTSLKKRTRRTFQHFPSPVKNLHCQTADKRGMMHGQSDDTEEDDEFGSFAIMNNTAQPQGFNSISALPEPPKNSRWSRQEEGAARGGKMLEGRQDQLSVSHWQPNWQQPVAVQRLPESRLSSSTIFSSRNTKHNIIGGFGGRSRSPSNRISIAAIQSSYQLQSGQNQVSALKVGTKNTSKSYKAKASGIVDNNSLNRQTSQTLINQENFRGSMTQKLRNSNRPNFFDVKPATSRLTLDAQEQRDQLQAPLFEVSGRHEAGQIQQRLSMQPGPGNMAAMQSPHRQLHQSHAPCEPSDFIEVEANYFDHLQQPTKPDDYQNKDTVVSSTSQNKPNKYESRALLSPAVLNESANVLVSPDLSEQRSHPATMQISGRKSARRNNINQPSSGQFHPILETHLEKSPSSPPRHIMAANVNANANANANNLSAKEQQRALEIQHLANLPTSSDCEESGGSDRAAGSPGYSHMSDGLHRGTSHREASRRVKGAAEVSRGIADTAGHRQGSVQNSQRAMMGPQVARMSFNNQREDSQKAAAIALISRGSSSQIKPSTAARSNFSSIHDMNSNRHLVSPSRDYYGVNQHRDAARLSESNKSNSLRQILSPSRSTVPIHNQSFVTQTERLRSAQNDLQNNMRINQMMRMSAHDAIQPYDQEVMDSQGQEDEKVLEEPTLVRSGTTVRKKIVFMDSALGNKSATGGYRNQDKPNSVSGNFKQAFDAKNQKSMLQSAQSYAQIESGSSEDLEVDDIENVISYTSSNRQNNMQTAGQSGNQKRSSTLDKKDQTVSRGGRPHSNSVQGPIGSFGSSFHNLASSFLVSKDGDGDEVVLEQRSAAANGDVKQIDTTIQGHKDAKPAEPAGAGESASGFGFVSRLFDWVTRSNVVNNNKDEKIGQSPMKDNKEDCDGEGHGEEDLLAPHIEERSPILSSKGRARNKLAAEYAEKPILPQENKSERMFFSQRAHSKTVHHEQRNPLLSMVKPGQNPRLGQPQEKLRQIDSIVFNQDKSHFAVVWTDGGFTKFEVATLQVIQNVKRTPPSTYYEARQRASDDENVAIIACSTPRARHQNSYARQLEKVTTFDQTSSEAFLQAAKGNDSDSDALEEQEEFLIGRKTGSIELFKCVALQHRTNDYAATLVSNPSQVIFVHIPRQHDYHYAGKNWRSSQYERRRQKDKQMTKSKNMPLGQRKLVKHFKEDVSQIQIMPGARYTLIALKTAIYIYTKNSQELYDIVSCSHANICSAIVKPFDQKLVLASMTFDEQSPAESVFIHDYGVSPYTDTDTKFRIDKPFSAGYKVGGVQLDETGQRIVVVSADGCYIHLFNLIEHVISTDEKSLIRPPSEQPGQDQAAPEHGADSSFLSFNKKKASYHSTNTISTREIAITTPTQSFVRSSSSSKAIYMPIQIVEGFSMHQHICDFILLSTSSMTTHMFALKTSEELEESKATQKEASGWAISRFLPQSFSMERSKIRLNIPEELAPAQPIVQPPRRDPNQSMQSNFGSLFASTVDPDSTVEENVYKNYLKELPYTCFVESSGLLVVISHSGFCCKFSIELQGEYPSLDLRGSGAHYHSTAKGPRLSPTSLMRNSSMLNQSHASLSQSLALLGHVKKSSLKRKNAAASPAQKNRSQVRNGSLVNQRGNKAAKGYQSPTTKLQIDTKDELSKTPNGKLDLSNIVRVPTTAQNSGSTAKKLTQPPTTSAMKRAGAFSGYKEPTLRLKFKIKDFFVKIDHKALSLRRTERRRNLQKRASELQERAALFSKQSNNHGGNSLLESANNRYKQSNTLRKLLSGN